METATSPQAMKGARPAPADAESLTSIAEDRLEGALAIGRFIDPNMTLREVRRRLEGGHYPCWKEGRFFVASKAALLKHWREKTAGAVRQSQPGAPQPQNKSARRGYLGSPRGG